MELTKHNSLVLEQGKIVKSVCYSCIQVLSLDALKNLTTPFLAAAPPE